MKDYMYYELSSGLIVQFDDLETSYPISIQITQYTPEHLEQEVYADETLYECADEVDAVGILDNIAGPSNQYKHIGMLDGMRKADLNFLEIQKNQESLIDGLLKETAPGYWMEIQGDTTDFVSVADVLDNITELNAKPNKTLDIQPNVEYSVYINQALRYLEGDREELDVSESAIDEDWTTSLTIAYLRQYCFLEEHKEQNKIYPHEGRYGNIGSFEYYQSCIDRYIEQNGEQEFDTIIYADGTDTDELDDAWDVAKTSYYKFLDYEDMGEGYLTIQEAFDEIQEAKNPSALENAEDEPSLEQPSQNIPSQSKEKGR